MSDKEHLRLTPGQPVTRRQALKLGGIAAVGLAFTKPVIDTIYPKPAFANYVPPPNGGLQGCTPGFWQGKNNGALLWDEVYDPHWAAHGGSGHNPFIHTDKFNDFFAPIPGGDSLTMMNIVGTGGGSHIARKPARDVIAAYLNASFGLDYGLTPQEIEDLWSDARNQYVNNHDSSGLFDLHEQLDDLNNLHNNSLCGGSY